MKNKLKSARRGSKTAAASQSKTKTHKANAPHRPRPSGTVTCVWTASDGSEWERVEFPRDLFARIESCASKLGISLQQFFDNAIRNFVKSQAIRGCD